jgi:hypothetical protein
MSSLPGEPAMPPALKFLDQVSIAAGRTNDDRVGHAGNLAWAIDGATDVLAERLLPGASDAAWFAGALDRAFHDAAERGAATLTDVLAAATAQSASAFAALARRPPLARHEHPSAAGVLARLAGDRLDYLALADCQLIVAPPDAPPCVLGFDPATEAGDQRAVAAMQSIRAASGGASWRTVRAELIPRFRLARERLNQPDGYAAFSITPPPADLVRHGAVDVARGTVLLLATDGLMRLVDVFRRYDLAGLVAAARSHGLAALAEELRGLERADLECLAHPRTKPHDDASAILLEVAG